MAPPMRLMAAVITLDGATDAVDDSRHHAR
jgi:hypothetical protein